MARRTTASCSTVTPTVQAYAKAALRDLLLLQGDRAGAAAQNRDLGFVTSFAILGPFDNDGRRGHAAVYPPEQEERAPGAEQTYEGRHARLPLHWRLVPPEMLARDGSLRIDPWMSPDTQGTVYAVSYVRSAAAQRPAPQRLSSRISPTKTIRLKRMMKSRL